MFAPAKIKARSLSGESVAGPSVQMIFVLRMAVVDERVRFCAGILREVWKGSRFYSARCRRVIQSERKKMRSSRQPRAAPKG